MANHIDGPLYYERMGRTGPVIAFVHPNPMDQSCWIFQMAQMSTWFRCIAIDVPGYGRSPKCRKGVSMNDINRSARRLIRISQPFQLARAQCYWPQRPAPTCQGAGTGRLNAL